jgi:hypothetical protein
MMQDQRSGIVQDDKDRKGYVEEAQFEGISKDFQKMVLQEEEPSESV